MDATQEFREVVREIFDNLDLMAWAIDTEGKILVSEDPMTGLPLDRSTAFADLVSPQMRSPGLFRLRPFPGALL